MVYQTTKQKEEITAKSIDTKKSELTANQYIRHLAGINCTKEEISIATGITTDTLDTQYSNQLEQGYNDAKIRLKDALMMHMYSGNATLLKYLAENYLGYGKDEGSNTESGGISYISVCPTCKSLDTGTITEDGKKIQDAEIKETQDTEIKKVV